MLHLHNRVCVSRELMRLIQSKSVSGPFSGPVSPHLFTSMVEFAPQSSFLASSDAVPPVLAGNPLSAKATSVPFCRRWRDAREFRSRPKNDPGSHVVVVVDLPQPGVVTPPSLAAPLREPGSRILAEEVQFPDFAEGRAKLLDAEGVNDGVDGRVAVGEDDCDVNEVVLLLARRAEEGDAVEDVKRQPADCKEEEDKSQGFG